ncbi:WHS11 [Brettanomyces bruxellensis]|uniref:DEBR0S3_06304g1_1 n=1 Tax=Dekkera bruxellensis TaxID=5007 RepID=A0A3F2Y6X6_DEKBR|nr:uncharacterized protein BRETT_000636 [Brettanomyces bruxellensis]QOU20922.1 hypothetical protein BRETT_000636 [Brettanomyces bruxellensis]VUG18268.1 WHS11 [Brettanomyces bruxellensis]
MSDSGRKNFGDKISEGIQPDSDKSNVQKVKEGVTDTADKLAGKTQREEDKGLFQKISDTLGGKK